MKVLLASSEAVPFCKTGGLADVAGALSRELSRLKQKVSLFIPYYKAVKEAGLPFKAVPGSFRVPVGDSLAPARLLSMTHGAVTVYAVDNPGYFSRDGLYGEDGKDYDDNDERFIFFCRAVLEGAKFVDDKPDVIHAHDWQTALLSAYLKTLYRSDAFYARTGTVLTIHNIAYQGLFHKDALFLAGFGWADFTPDRLEYYGGVNLLKAGLVFTDVLTTVSPTYAREIQSSAESGRGLEGVLRQRSRDLHGILNGLDTEVWDPASDVLIERRYGLSDAKAGKEANQSALRRECGLAPGGPLVAIVSRLDPQKGVDIALEALSGPIGKGVKLAALGTGDPALETALAGLARRHPQSVHFHAGFDDAFAHRLYASADIFLMPSRFEPCGLGQMIAMRYGAVPVVTRTGGLADTVREETQEGAPANGFVAERAEAGLVAAALERACAALRSPPRWAERRAAGMAGDYSWKRPAAAYVDLYHRAAEGR